jgi:hypothetical protein
MKNIYNHHSFVKIAICFFLVFYGYIQNKSYAQVNVTLTYNKTAHNNCGSCTDCSGTVCVGGGADQYWETEMNPTGGSYTGNGDNDRGSVSNGSYTSTDIGFWCPGGSVQGRVRTCEDDDYGGCGGGLDDCVTGWVYGANTIINTTTTSVGATSWSISGGSCTSSGTWSLSSSGSWPGNNIVNTTGTTNPSCATARYLGNNTSGSLLGGDESVDCSGSVWYSYYLTQDLTDISFDASAKGTFNGCSEDEVYWNSTNSCSGGCNIGDDFGIGVWGINNPRQGYYFIRVSMPTTVSGRQYDFTMNVSKGGVVSRPSNDRISCATVLAGSTLDRCEQVSLHQVSNVGATDEDRFVV